METFIVCPTTSIQGRVNILEETCHEAPGIGRHWIWGKVHGFRTVRHSELFDLGLRAHGVDAFVAERSKS